MNTIDMQTIQLWSIPVISALIGWFTNWLAVQMLFRPVEPFWGFQGLVPKRKEELAIRISEIVESELVSHHDIVDALVSPEFTNIIVGSIEQRVEELLKKHFSRVPFFKTILGLSTIQAVKAQHLQILQREVPLAIANMAQQAEQGLKIRERIEGKMRQLDTAQLEALVRRVSSQELRFIELLGGVVGFLIGLVQMLLVM